MKPELSREEDHSSAYLLQEVAIEEGLYYRLHLKSAPFGPEHASSKPFVPDEVLANPDWIGHSRGFADPRPGYSAFWNPHHLEQYIKQFNWDFCDSQVIAFRGEPIGQGYDGEPLVMPSSEILEVFDFEDFCYRLEITANGYGRWDEHSWGDGPNGQICDDGYRLLGESL